LKLVRGNTGGQREELATARVKITSTQATSGRVKAIMMQRASEIIKTQATTLDNSLPNLALARLKIGILTQVFLTYGLMLIILVELMI